MNIADYFGAVRDCILAASFVMDFKISKYIDRSKNGHLRARIFFADESQLEFSEFVEQDANDEIRLVTYSYHWSDQNDNLIRRWDNSPHFRKHGEAKDHIHKPVSDAEDEVTPGIPTNIFAILDEIAKIIGQE